MYAIIHYIFLILKTKYNLSIMILPSLLLHTMTSHILEPKCNL